MDNSKSNDQPRVEESPASFHSSKERDEVGPLNYNNEISASNEVELPDVYLEATHDKSVPISLVSIEVGVTEDRPQMHESFQSHYSSNERNSETNPPHHGVSSTVTQAQISAEEPSSAKEVEIFFEGPSNFFRDPVESPNEKQTDGETKLQPEGCFSDSVLPPVVSEERSGLGSVSRRVQYRSVPIRGKQCEKNLNMASFQFAGEATHDIFASSSSGQSSGMTPQISLMKKRTMKSQTRSVLGYGEDQQSSESSKMAATAERPCEQMNIVTIIEDINEITIPSLGTGDREPFDYRSNLEGSEQPHYNHGFEEGEQLRRTYKSDEACVPSEESRMLELSFQFFVPEEKYFRPLGCSLQLDEACVPSGYIPDLNTDDYNNDDDAAAADDNAADEDDDAADEDDDAADEDDDASDEDDDDDYYDDDDDYYYDDDDGGGDGRYRLQGDQFTRDCDEDEQNKWGEITKVDCNPRSDEACVPSGFESEEEEISSENSVRSEQSDELESPVAKMLKVDCNPKSDEVRVQSAELEGSVAKIYQAGHNYRSAYSGQPSSSREPRSENIVEMSNQYSSDEGKGPAAKMLRLE